MELRYLVLSNIDDYNSSLNYQQDAENNYSKFISSLDNFRELEQTKNMYNNILDMENKLRDLEESSVIKQTDATYILLNGNLNEAMKIHMITDKKISDTFNFYSNYGNFIETYNQVR